MELESLVESGQQGEQPIDRVRQHTPTRMNQKIDQETLKRVWQYAYKPREVLTQRIEELEKEWDIERIIETNAASLSLAGLVLSATVDRKWLLLPAAVMTCLLQHCLKRKSLPVQVLRGLGVRTRKEIEAEKYALKLLRGDFDAVNRAVEQTHRAIEALRVARM
jgi:hypothetical protein